MVIPDSNNQKNKLEKYKIAVLIIQLILAIIGGFAGGYFYTQFNINTQNLGDDSNAQNSQGNNNKQVQGSGSISENTYINQEPIATSYEISPSRKLNDIKLELHRNVTYENVEKFLIELRKKQLLQSLSDYTSVGKTPVNTYFYIVHTDFNSHGEDFLERILRKQAGFDAQDRYAYYEVHNLNNKLFLLVYINEQQLNNYYLDGKTPRTIEVYPYPFENKDSLLIIPLERIGYVEWKYISPKDSSIFILRLILQ